MSGDVLILVVAAVLVVVAGLFSAADAALVGFSRARAEELNDEGKSGAESLIAVLDDRPRYLNTALLLRMLAEIAATVIVTLWLHDEFDGHWWAAFGTALGVMLLVSFVVIGVAPRTLGRQHASTVAPLMAGPVRVLTAVLGPIPKLLILFGNAITPGRGFRTGPFQSETELRELVDLAEASSVIEDSERRMVHSVFELGDTNAREVMVPRTDVVYVERHKDLRQALSLFLRSGYSRLPVVGDNLDDILGFAYLKDLVRWDFEHPEANLGREIGTLIRPAHFVPESKPVDALLEEMQAMRQHIAVVVDEYGGTAGLITIEDVLEEIVGEITDEYDTDYDEVEDIGGGWHRISSRYPVDDLDEIFEVKISDDDVDSVGGLMAKYLGRVPIPGAVVEVDGLRFEAERSTGRRNKVGTILVSQVATSGVARDPEGEPPEREHPAPEHEHDVEERNDDE